MSLTGRLASTFGGPGMKATVDTSDLDELRRLLSDAADNAPKGVEKVLDSEVPKVKAEAERTVRGYPTATGETADSMDFDWSGPDRRIWATTKQAALLEYGTPTTGGPRAWLTGPAEAGSRRVLTAMAEVGRIW